MTRRYHANNFSTTLSSSLTTSATTMTVASIAGLPTIGAGETYRLTITQGNIQEIVVVTSRSSTTLTITRAAESTSAKTFAAGAVVELRATADSLDRKVDLTATSGDVLNFGDATSLEVPNSAAPTLTATGQLALDTTVTDYADGVLQYYTGSTKYGVIAMPDANFTSPTDGYVVAYDAATDQFKLAAGGGGGSGDVAGPSSATDNAITRFDSTTGKLIQNSTATLDDNGNVFCNNKSIAYTTTATAGGSTTLTVASTGIQYFTGTTTQTIVLPVTSTLSQGFSFTIYNLSTGNLTVNSSGGNLVVTIGQGMFAVVQCILTSGTTAASWEYFGTAGANASSTQTTDRFLLLDASNSFRMSYITPTGISHVGTIGTGTWQANAVGVLYGGTGLSSLSQGDIIYGSASNTFSKLAKDANATRYLSNTGTSNNPAWAQVNLTNGVTGTLPVANGGTGVTTSTGSGNNVLSTSPTLVTPILGAASATSIAFTSTSGIIGTTTNDTAAAGSVGEYISATIPYATATAITTATTTDLTSISLTAGDWIVIGNVGLVGTSTTEFYSLYQWVSATSVTIPQPELYGAFNSGSAVPFKPAGNVFWDSSTPATRFSLASTTTIYLTMRSNFTTSTASAFGKIQAWRIR